MFKSIKTKMKTRINECTLCHGFGLHALGDPSPMGRMDAQDGLPTQVCPECGQSYNDKDNTIRARSRQRCTQ